MKTHKEWPGRKPGSLAWNGKYDWDLIFDGCVHELVEGVDFDCKPSSVRASAYRTSQFRGIKVRTTARDGIVFIQAILDEGKS